MKYSIIICFSIFIFIGCDNESSINEKNRSKAFLDSLERVKEDSIRQFSINRIKDIKAKYNYSDFFFIYDDFSEEGYYNVQTDYDYKKSQWGKLWLRILDNGELLFASVYFSRERLYHTMIQAKIGDSLITSQEVPLTDYSNIVEGNYVETVYFTNKDNGILNAIVSSKDDENIRIRLIGDEYYTYSLKRNDIIKLKEGYEFANLLKYLELTAKEQHQLGF